MSGNMYPSLEDMKVDHMCKAQVQMYPGGIGGHPSPQSSDLPYPTAPQSTLPPGATAMQATLPYPCAPAGINRQDQKDITHLFPDLSEYMGQEFTSDVIAANMPEYIPAAPLYQTLDQFSPLANSGIVAPLSGSSVGLRKAQVTHGVREVIVCKDADHRIGIRVKAVNKGIFICMVKKGSPSSMVGLRFGDQILQINDENVAAYSMDKVHNIFKKLADNNIRLAVRDRPFERTVTLHKDSSGHIGFQFRDGEICALVKDSSAARNGLLTDHFLLEVNGQNVVGLKDKETGNIINDAGQIVTVTVMPTFVYKLIIKHMDNSLLTKLMDHSIPEL